MSPYLLTHEEIRAWLLSIGATDATAPASFWRARRPPVVVDLDGKPVQLYEHPDGSWRTTPARGGR